MGPNKFANKHVHLKGLPEKSDYCHRLSVMILNYAVGLDVARDGTQSNTQDVWPCKLPIDSLPLQLLAKSPKLMSDLSKQSRRNFPNAVAG